MALNVFLYNLTEDLIRIVRLKGCPNLETALSIVTEEVNFMSQFNAKQKQRQAVTPSNKLHPMLNTTPNNNFKFGNPQGNPHNIMSSQNAKFGLHQQQPHGFRFGNQPQGFRFGNQPHGFRFGNQPQNPTVGFKFNQNSGPQNFKFGIPR